MDTAKTDTHPTPRQEINTADDPLGMVPAAGKHAARPSQAERHESLRLTPDGERVEEPVPEIGGDV